MVTVAESWTELGMPSASPIVSFAEIQILALDGRMLTETGTGAGVAVGDALDPVLGAGDGVGLDVF
jgi:hypothetical protein